MLRGFEGDDNIKENSPVKRADELKTPLLLVHGTKDIQVQLDQFKHMKSALKKSPAKRSWSRLKTAIIALQHLSTGKCCLKLWTNT